MASKISVIIPAYNAERTIERTIKTVLASTIPLDVWIVDDGSTDATGVILNRLAKANTLNSSRKSNLIVLHQQNRGAYQARLAALKQIRTPYFGFVDADDLIVPEMYATMMDVLVANDLDSVQCEIFGSKSGKVGLEVVEGDALKRHKYNYLVNAKESCFVWDKLYRNVYDFASFELTDRVTNFEDMIFNFQFFAKIKRLGILHKGLYHYQATEGSAVHSFGKRQEHDFWWMARNHWRFVRGLFPQGEISIIQLWIGHHKWFWRNFRNVLVCKLRNKL